MLNQKGNLIITTSLLQKMVLHLFFFVNSKNINDKEILNGIHMLRLLI